MSFSESTSTRTIRISGPDMEKDSETMAYPGTTTNIVAGDSKITGRIITPDGQNKDSIIVTK